MTLAFVSIDGLAEKLNTSRDKVLLMIAEGALPRPSIIGGLVRWSEVVLREWEAAGFPAGEPATAFVSIQLADCREQYAEFLEHVRQVESDSEKETVE